MTTAPGVGVDLVDVRRFGDALERRQTMTRRLFSERELDEATRSRHTASHVQSLAARFAAKEATFKALGVGNWAVRFREVETLKDDDGVPRLVLSGAARELAQRRGVDHLDVSLSHTDQMAVAVVVAR